VATWRRAIVPTPPARDRRCLRPKAAKIPCSEPVVLVLHLLYLHLDHAEPREGLARDTSFPTSTSVFENPGHHHPERSPSPYPLTGAHSGCPDLAAKWP